jgi:sugar phosphate isomerase/epimerase
MGHLDQVGVCLDLGHAHVTVGIAEAVATLGARIASVHVHDNHGMKDEHLWPGDGTIDWPVAVKYLKELHTPPATVLEISQNLPDTMTEIEDRIAKGFALFD